ncbi:MAG: substrate-binding domain-containing protein [Lentisphaeria bacterium]
MPKILTETKHYQAAVQLRNYINTLTPGDVLPITKVLIAKFGFSHGTIIQALKTLAGEKLITRKFGKQRYLVASINNHFSKKICVIRPDSVSPGFDPILRGLYETGQEQNWQIIDSTYNSLESFDFQKAMENVDGCVLIPPSQIIDKDLLQALKRPSRPVVVLLQHLKDTAIANVCIDDYAVGKLAAQTLYDLGHRNILVLRDQPHESTTQERLRGYQITAKKLGIPSGNQFIADMHLVQGDDTLNLCYQRFNQFMKQRNRPKFDAIFTLSLSGGAAALRVLFELNLNVPKDISILSYGGESGFAPYFNPPLSCIEIDINKFGYRTILLLEKMIKSRDYKSLQYKIQPKLILRGSVKKIK